MRRALFAVLVGLVSSPAWAQDRPYTYVACSAAQAVTAAADLLHVEAGADAAATVLKLWIVPGSQTTAGYHQVVVRRTTTASTGGSTVTPSPMDPNAPAFRGVVRAGATGGGTDGVTLLNASYYVPTAATQTTGEIIVLFDASAGQTPFRIVKGGTTGIEVRNATGGAGGANHYACALVRDETS